jgi:hypothetical protein
MCPSGVIACATSPGEVVTNGWSPSKQDQARLILYVVELKLEDFKPYAKYGALAEWNSKEYRAKSLASGR